MGLRSKDENQDTYGDGALGTFHTSDDDRVFAQGHAESQRNALEAENAKLKAQIVDWARLLETYGRALVELDCARAAWNAVRDTGWSTKDGEVVHAHAHVQEPCETWRTARDEARARIDELARELVTLPPRG